MDEDGRIDRAARTAALRSGRSLAPGRIAESTSPRRACSRRIASWQNGCAALGKGTRCPSAGALRRGAGERARWEDLPALAHARARRTRPLARRRPRALGRLRGLAGRRALRDHQGMVGLARPDLESAASWLREPAERAAAELGEGIPDDLVRRLWSGEIDRDLVVDLQRRVPGDLGVALSSCAGRGGVLLRSPLARRLRGGASLRDRKWRERLAFLAAPQAQWLERAGDAAFLDHDPHGARARPTRARSTRRPIGRACSPSSPTSPSRSETSTASALYRERIYGSLVRQSR